MNKKLALITGASRGIGRAAAEKFAENGYDLILVCQKNIDILEAFLLELTEKFSIQCLGFAGDMGCFSEVERLFFEVKKRFGNRSIDVIVNNAGISYIGLLTTMSPEDWNRVISVNLNSVFYICRLFVPDMILAQSGTIINISSVWGNIGASCEAAYSASKGGVNSFTKALAKELAPSHISVNAIAFGIIDTEMNDFLSPEDKESLLEEIPACRMGTPKEAAEIIFSVAVSSKYLTGQVITVDGGWS